MKISNLSYLFVVLALVTFSKPVFADSVEYKNEYYLGGGFHGTFLTGVGGGPLLTPRLGWAVKGGKRWTRWGMFLQLEQDFWEASDFENNVVQGAFNPGIGVEYRYAYDILSLTMAAGPSILIFETNLDSAGQVGIFFDLRPTRLRWQPFSDNDSFVIKFDPLTLTVVIPVLTGIPLIQIEYRTALSVEFRL